MDPFTTAQALMKRGATDSALALLRGIAIENPTSARAHRAIVQCFHELRDGGRGYWRECDSFYHNAYRGRVPPTIRTIVIGLQADCDQQPEDVIRAFRQVVQEAPDSSVCWLGLASAYRRIKRRADACDAYERALATEDAPPEVMDQYSAWLFDEGRFGRLSPILAKFTEWRRTANHGDAIPEWEIAWSAVTARIGAASSLAQAVRLRAAQKPTDAVRLLWKVLRDHPRNCTLIHAACRLLHECDWLMSARTGLESILGHADAYLQYAMALSQYNTGLISECMATTDNVLEKGLSHPLLHLLRALAFERCGDSRAEDAELELIAREQPWLLAASAERAENAFALKDYDRVLGITNVSPCDERDARTYGVSGKEVVERLGYYRIMALGRLGRAGEVQHRPRRGASEIARLHFARSMAHARAGDHETAARLLDRAIVDDFHSMADVDDQEAALIENLRTLPAAQYGVHLAHALCPVFLANSLGDPEDKGGDESRNRAYKECISRLSRMAKRFPKNASSHMHRGLIHEMAGHAAQADRVYKRCIRLDPHDEVSVEWYAMFLEKQRKIRALLQLATRVAHPTIPLKCALRVARECQSSKQQLEIAAKLLVEEPTNTLALLVRASHSRPGTRGQADAFDALSSVYPFDFRTRLFVARSYAILGDWPAAIIGLDSLMSDGCSSAEMLALSGICRCVGAGGQSPVRGRVRYGRRGGSHHSFNEHQQEKTKQAQQDE